MGLFKKYYKQLNERTEGKSYDFSSSQIDFDLDLSQRIYDWSLDKIPDSNLGKDGRQPIADHHITCLFGLHTSYPEDLFPLVQCFNPFTVKLGKVSLFHKDDEDVVKFDILDSEPLFRINQFFKNNLHYEETFPIYVPHATIAFVKPGLAKHLVGNSDFEETEILVNGISFSSKLGEKTFIPFVSETYSPPIGRFDYRYRS